VVIATLFWRLFGAISTLQKIVLEGLAFAFTVSVPVAALYANLRTSGTWSRVSTRPPRCSSRAEGGPRRGHPEALPVKNILRALRSARGWSQSGAAAVSRQTVNALRSARTTPAFRSQRGSRTCSSARSRTSSIRMEPGDRAATARTD
jgi:hypothetical protein